MKSIISNTINKHINKIQTWYQILETADLLRGAKSSERLNLCQKQHQSCVPHQAVETERQLGTVLPVKRIGRSLWIADENRTTVSTKQFTGRGSERRSSLRILSVNNYWVMTGHATPSETMLTTSLPWKTVELMTTITYRLYAPGATAGRLPSKMVDSETKSDES